MDGKSLALGAIWYVVFLFSTVCHEGAHALAAKLGGDVTASQAGQVTLNPIPHMKREPMGTIFVPIISYVFAGWMLGWASAPYDRAWAERYPRRAAWMALAGPAANFILMIVAGVAIHVGIGMGKFEPPATANFTHIATATGAVPSGGSAEMAATVLSILFVLNLLLGTFNLLPFAPLDGHSGITVLMTRRAAARFTASTFAGLGFLGLIAAWVVYDRIFSVIFSIALNLLYPGLHYGKF